MWAIPTGISSVIKKKEIQVKSPIPESRVSKTNSDPPIGSNRDSGRDTGGPLTTRQLAETLANVR